MTYTDKFPPDEYVVLYSGSKPNFITENNDEYSSREITTDKYEKLANQDVFSGYYYWDGVNTGGKVGFIQFQKYRKTDI
jgi:hypothetical protein